MLRSLSAFLLLGAVTGCGGAADHGPTDPLAHAKQVLEGFGQRAGLVLEHDLYGDGASKLVYLDQGWGPGETLWYYHADQGSVMMPYDLFVHLEQADADAPFIAPEHVSRWRLLPQHATPNNPDALPVGLARHDDSLGLTCAACHTTQINYQGTAMRIDGAGAVADVTGFFRGVSDAMAATLADDAKLGRLADALGAKDVAAVRKRLADASAYLDSYIAANKSATVEGFGRIDAIDRIFNQVIRFTSGPENSIEPNAPASIPLLWDAPRHDYVQWAGFATNADAGALGRNAGEVVGVFGKVEVQHYDDADRAKKQGYASTIEGNGLVSMEHSLYKLESPMWPEEILPPIDHARAERGQAIYQQQCASCHALIDRDDPQRKVVAMVTGIDVVGTDPTEAQNLAGTRAPTGVLEGAPAWNGGTYGKTEPATRLLGDLVSRSLARQPIAGVRAIALGKLHHQEKTAKQGQHATKTDADPSAELRSYKARPLNGTWASSPYLHNGSVPTLYDLLLPPAQRPARFSTGRFEYDPRKVGYVDDDGPFVIDTSVKGNSNQGHEYGTALSDDDRWALVEYLKTL